MTIKPDDATALTVSDLAEIMAHLGAARIQRAPNDDQIIADHIDDAYEAARSAWRRIVYGHDTDRGGQSC